MPRYTVTPQAAVNVPACESAVVTFRLIGNNRAAAPCPFNGSGAISAGQFWTVSENARYGFRLSVFDAMTTCWTCTRL